LIEELMFGFVTLKWGEFDGMDQDDKKNYAAEVSPIHALLKTLFLPYKIDVNGEGKRLAGDLRILSMLRARDIRGASEIAVQRLRVGNRRPLQGEYFGGVDADRLAGSLLMRVWQRAVLEAGIRHPKENEIYS